MFVLIKLYCIWIALHLIFCSAATYLIIGCFSRIWFKFQFVWVYSVYSTNINVHCYLWKVCNIDVFLVFVLLHSDLMSKFTWSSNLWHWIELEQLWIHRISFHLLFSAKNYIHSVNFFLSGKNFGMCFDIHYLNI